MNKIVEAAETLSDLQQEKKVIQKEVSKLSKMIKTGFEGKQAGLDKVAKVYSSELNEDVDKFYTSIGNSIKGIALAGNFEKFKDFLSLNFGISLVDYEPKLSYTKKDKKKQKFQDLYEEYFLDPAPNKADEAMKKIMVSMSANFKEIKKESDKIKEEFEQVNTSVGCPKRTLQTLTSIISKAKSKDVDVKEVTSDIEIKISEEQMALDLLENNNEKKD